MSGNYLSHFKFLFVLLLTALCLSACESKNIEGGTKLAFYYWKTTFTLNDEEKAILSENDVSKLYLRFFDIALKNEQSVPIGKVQFLSAIPENIEIVPVVYIKNEVFLQKEIAVADLAVNTIKLIEEMGQKNGLNFDEVQLDCDWSLQSKENWNQFVREIKKISGKKISATIRLHQIKYKDKTSVPEVDEGVLMYYNMGQINANTENSIYDRNIARKYIGSLRQYPKPLNISLPIYSWAIHIRSGKVINLISKIDLSEINNNPEIFQEHEGFYSFSNGQIMWGNYFREGDIIKIEHISQAQLLEMVRDLKHELKQAPNEIILYDLDALNFKNNNYDQTIFKQLIAVF